MDAFFTILKQELLVTGFIFIVLLSGCSTQSWKYTSNPKQYIKPEIQKTVVIPPLSDFRENENSITGYFVAMIPFVRRCITKCSSSEFSYTVFKIF